MVNVRALRAAALALLCLAAAPVSSALAARRSAARPAISSIGPSSVAVGDTLTIRGRGFLAGKRRNTVSFKRAGSSPTVSVKAGDATRTRIRVVVPAALARFLSDTKPTRFAVRVRARRSSKAAAARSWVLISPADAPFTPGDSAACEPSGGLGDLTGLLDDALGTGLGDALDTLLPDDGCAAADVPAAGDDPATGDDGADPAGALGDDGGPVDPADALGADDTITG